MLASLDILFARRKAEPLPCGIGILLERPTGEASKMCDHILHSSALVWRSKACGEIAADGTLKGGRY